MCVSEKNLSRVGNIKTEMGRKYTFQSFYILNKTWIANHTIAPGVIIDYIELYISMMSTD